MFKSKRVLVLGLAALSACLLAGCGASHKEIATDMLPKVERVGLEKFSAIDTDNNGLLDEAELLRAARSSDFSKGDRAVLQHMYDYRSWIGHVTSSKTEEVPVTTLIPMPDGNGGFWYMPVTNWETQTTNFYGISKHDLETYRDRLQKIK
jgi:hypothetical protein